MSQLQISIIGAGIAGLVLGKCLAKRGIPAVLFERDAFRPSSPRHNYGITLEPWAYRHLLPYLDLDDRTFRSKIAVDAAVGGTGRVERCRQPNTATTDATASFRANRSKLESLLSEGLDIRWEHALADIKPTSTGNTLTFRNGKQLQSQVVIGTDGVHSQVRQSISPSTKFNILPYAVYSGKRRISRKDFDNEYAPYMDGANVIETRISTTFLQISINDINPDNVSLSYTYSRPARQDDPLFKPDRPKSGATEIPEAFFDEILSLTNLKAPFDKVFNPETTKSDRLLNWLMRTVLIPAEHLYNVAEKGIVLIGESVQAEPILSSHGANEAISEALDLAHYIASDDFDASTSVDMGYFYNRKYGVWRKWMERSETRLAEMHGMQERSSL